MVFNLGNLFTDSISKYILFSYIVVTFTCNLSLGVCFMVGWFDNYKVKQSFKNFLFKLEFPGRREKILRGGGMPVTSQNFLLTQLWESLLVEVRVLFLVLEIENTSTTWKAKALPNIILLWF